MIQGIKPYTVNVATGDWRLEGLSGVDSAKLDSPQLKGIVERIKNASLSLEKKKDLVLTVINVFNNAAKNDLVITTDILKKIYAVIDIMELASDYKAPAHERADHNRALDIFIERLLEKKGALVTQGIESSQQPGVRVGLDITV